MGFQRSYFALQYGGMDIAALRSKRASHKGTETTEDTEILKNFEFPLCPSCVRPKAFSGERSIYWAYASYIYSSTRSPVRGQFPGVCEIF